MMDLRAIRDRLASQGPTGIIGHPRPPGTIADFPCYVVGDPTLIEYHPTYANRTQLELPITIVVGRNIEDDGTGDLDDWVSSITASIEAITPDSPALWVNKPVAGALTGGYRDWAIQTPKGPQVVGVAATIPFRITPT